MGLFDRKRKSAASKLGRGSGSSEEFDFSNLEDMSGEFGDDHNVPTTRKATIKNYVTDHYKNKFTDRGERKKLLKQAMPSSYSGPIDLAHDLKDDYDEIKYEVGKEWEKVKSPLKTALKGNEKFLRFVPGGKKLSKWAQQDSGDRFQEQEANQDEALVQSMLADFTSPQAIKERTASKKLKQMEQEDATEFRSQSLSLQMQGAANSGNSVAELRKLVNYQDQVTYLYQKKSLEIGIRSLIEHRKQTDMFRVYKDESMAELKEIHKNTALPEVVKTNNSEIASQLFKEKMIGSAQQWFSGKFSGVRKRITSRIRDKLTEMTRDFGSSLSSFNEMMQSAQESGSSGAGMLGRMGADSALNKVWDKATGRPLNWIRGKMASNAKIARFGRGANALNRNLGGMANKALLTGQSGNKTLDKFMDFMGLKQAAVSRDDNMRQSLSKNLDTAAYMDIRFKQTVERVIPHWLQLIHKENRLMRVGWGFKEGDGKNGTIEHKQKSWDWNKEEMVDVDDMKNDVLSKTLDRDRIKSYGESFERLLMHMGAQALTRPTKEKLKEWVNKRITGSVSATLYDLLVDLNKFTKKQQEELKLMICWKSGLSEDMVDTGLETGAWQEAALMFNSDQFAKWMTGYSALEQDFAGKSLVDWKHIQDMINQGHEKILEEAGFLVRQKDGSLNRNMDFNQDLVMKMTRMSHKKSVSLKAGEDEEYQVKENGVRKTKRRATVVVDEAKSHKKHEDMADANGVLDAEAFKLVQMLMDESTMDARTAAERKKLRKTYMDKLLSMTSAEAKKQGLLNRKASGGYAGRFSKGGYTGDGPIDGPIDATLDGKEFVNDAVTTEKNKALLEAMNKLKAPVILPDGTVNPVYYKAFGFKNEFDFKEAHQNNDQDVMDLIDSTKPKKNYGKAARSGFGKALKWANGDHSEGKAKRDKLIAESKKFFSSFRDELKGHSEEQLESLFWEIEKHGDHSLISDEDWAYLGDDSNSWADRVKRISGIYINRGNGAKYVKGALSKWSKDIKGSAKQRAKNFINGSEGDTTNTDELKKLGGKIKIKGQALAGRGKELWSDRDALVNTAIEKMRLKKAHDLAMKLWKDEAVDIYLIGSTASPRLTAIGFVSGDYVDKNTGRVCSSHHDITGDVTDKDGNVLLTFAEAEKGFCDKNGEPININTMKQYRNIAKDEAKKLYDKYAKKHVKRVLGGLLTATEKWQNLFKKTAVDVYVGDETGPRLVVLGFNNGSYFSETSKKPLKGWMDIDGPVLSESGTVIISAEDLESKLLFDSDGNQLKPPKLLSNLERLKNVVFKALSIDKVKSLAKKGWGKLKGFGSSLRGKILEGIKNSNEALKNEILAPHELGTLTAKNKEAIYSKDPQTGALGYMFNAQDMLDGLVYSVNPFVDNPDEHISKITSFDYLHSGTTVYVLSDVASVEGKAITWALLKSVGREVVKSSINNGVWYDGNGKKLSAKKLKAMEEISETIKSVGRAGKKSFRKMVGGWSDKAKSMLSGAGEKVGSKLRIGSWQWKREQKDKDSWISKLAGALGGHGDGKEKGEKKKGWLGKILGAIGMIAAPIVAGFAKIGNLIKDSIFGSMKWLAKKMMSGLSKVVVKPLIRALSAMAKGTGSFLGKHGGKLMRGAGLAAAAYGVYDGLKGEEKLDENGDPVLGKDGKPVTERKWGQVALSAGLGVASIPGGLAAVGSGLAAAAGFLAPIALPLAAVAAAAYGGYKLFQWWKKKDAEKDLPITAFRMNQYGFSITDKDMVEKLSQLEATLMPFVAVQGDKANFKQDTDVEAVFTIFGLKYEGGDQEKNKKFLAWFLGRFKPVYISYIQAMNALKNTSDLTDLEKKLGPADAIRLLERVHFKNQSEMNPYNVLISPTDDPDKCDYDFEDVVKRYADTLEILKVKAADMAESGDVGTLDDSAKKETKEKETVIGGFKEGFKKAGVIGGLVGGSINALKMIGKGAGDVFNSMAGSIKKGWKGMMEGFEGWITEKWEGLQAKFKSIAKFISNPLAAIKNFASGQVDKAFGAGTSAKIGAAATGAATAVGNAASSAGNSIGNAYGNAKQALFGSGKGGWHQNKPKELESWVSKYSQKYGVNSNDMLTMAWVESKGNPEAKSPTGYLGVYQFGQAAAKDAGLAWGDVMNPEKNTEAAIKYAAMNRKRFVKEVGREPAGFEIYMMHQNGYTGYKNIAMQAANNQPADAATRKLMDNNGGQGMSPAQFLAYWGKRWGESDAAVNGGSSNSTPATTTTAAAKPTASSATTAAAAGTPPTQAASGAGNSAAPGAVPSTTAPAGNGPTSVAPATSGVAGAKPATASTDAAGALALATPELVALGKSHYRLKDNKVTLAGMNETFMSLFWAMLGEAKQKGLAVVQINEGVRDYKEQCRLYDAYCAGNGPLAAKPGTSRHGFGEAMDCNTANCDELDSKGLLSKYGFSRPLMKKLASGNLTETWHIENKFVPNKNKKPELGKANDPNSASQTTSQGGNPSPTSSDGTIGGRPSVVNTGNSDINKVVNSGGGGGSSTSNVASAQAADAMSQSGVASILSQQLSVQTEMKSVLVEIRDCLVGQGGGNQELNRLKRPNASSEDIGAAIGGNVANMLAEKFGLGKPAETPKPVPIISSSK